MVLPLQVVIPQAFLSFPRFFSRKPLHQQIWQYHLIFATRFPISTAFPTLVYQLSCRKKRKKWDISRKNLLKFCFHGMIQRPLAYC